MRKYNNLKSNYLLASVISILNIGLRRRLRFIKLTRTGIAIRLLTILYKEGVIRTFVVIANQDKILVYFKYMDSINVCSKSVLISKPSKRCYWSLGRLSKVYNNHSFIGFYIISTPQGLVTSNYCLTNGHLSGEVLIRVEIA